MFATAGRHRVWNTTYIKSNKIDQNKLDRNVELQNQHIVLFKTQRLVMETNTLSARMGLKLELVHWGQDKTAVLYSHLLFDMSPQTDARLRYCTNSGPFPQKIETVIG